MQIRLYLDEDAHLRELVRIRAEGVKCNSLGHRPRINAPKEDPSAESAK